MPVTAITVQSQFSADSSSAFTFTDKVKADGYYGNSDGFHTVSYILSSDFVGIIKMQATLASDPIENDWFDIDGTTVGDGSSVVASTYKNFTGNFIWVRSAFTCTTGSITKIQINF